MWQSDSTTTNNWIFEYRYRGVRERSIELERIGWTNGTSPYISDTNLKAMEDNTENAINEVASQNEEAITSLEETMNSSIEDIESRTTTLESQVATLEEDTGWIDATLEDGVEATTSGYGGALGIQYRKIGNHVFVRGSVIATYSGSTVNLAQLPYAPTYRTYRFGQLNGTRISRIYVNPSGYVCLEWIANISDGSYYTSTPSWLAISIDFFVD